VGCDAPVRLPTEFSLVLSKFLDDPERFVFERLDEVDFAGETGLAEFSVGSGVPVRPLTKSFSILFKFLDDPECLVLERLDEVDLAGEACLA